MKEFISPHMQSYFRILYQRVESCRLRAQRSLEASQWDRERPEERQNIVGVEWTLRTELLEILASKVRKWIKKTAKSRPFRWLVWPAPSIVTAWAMAYSLFMIDWGLRKTPNWSLFWMSIFGLAVFLVLTSLFVVFRTEHWIFDPRLDIRYYARIQTELSTEPSQFLTRFHRTGYPIELDISHETALNLIENSVPFLLMTTGIGLSFLGFLSVVLYNQLTIVIMTINNFLFIVVLIALIALVVGWTYSFLHPLLFQYWMMYRLCKDFWIAFWTYIMNVFEPAEHVDEVTEYSGDWDDILPTKWLGENVDYRNPEFIAALRIKALDVMEDHNIGDELPSDDIELFDYLNRLALLVDLNEIIEDDHATLREIAEESERFRMMLDGISSLVSLQDVLTMVTLRSYKRTLDLTPVASLSLEAVAELDRIQEIPPRNRADIMHLVKERLAILWSLPESPVPNSLKWVGLFYSVASLVTTWFLSF